MTTLTLDTLKRDLAALEDAGLAQSPYALELRARLLQPTPQALALAIRHEVVA